MTSPTPDSDTPDTQDIAARLKSVMDYVRDCDRRVSMGEIMDLQGLDDTVMELCDILSEMPQDEAQVHEEKMTVLIKELEKLAKTMKAQQDKIDSTGGAA